MSRLDDEYLMAVIRNRSGQDSGELDYQLNVTRFEKLSTEDLHATLDLLDLLAHKVRNRLCTNSEP